MDPSILHQTFQTEIECLGLIEWLWTDMSSYLASKLSNIEYSIFMFG